MSSSGASFAGWVGPVIAGPTSSNIDTWSQYPMTNVLDGAGFQINNLGTPVGPSSIVRVCDLSGGSFHWSLIPAVSDVEMNGFKIKDCESLSTNSISTGTILVNDLSCNGTALFNGLSTNSAYIDNLIVGNINTSTITNSLFFTSTLTGNDLWYGPPGTSNNVSPAWQFYNPRGTSRLHALKNSNGDILPCKIDVNFQLNTDINLGNNLYAQGYVCLANFSTVSSSFIPSSEYISLPENFGFTSWSPNIFISKFGGPATYYNNVSGTAVIPSTIGVSDSNDDLTFAWLFSSDGNANAYFDSQSNLPITYTITPL